MSCTEHRRLASVQDMTPWLEQLVACIKGLGYKVVQNDPFLDVAGRVLHEHKEVRTNNNCAVCEILVLAHEAGHILHAIDEGETTKRLGYVEECALIYGWQILVEIGAPITLDVWLHDHEMRAPA